MRYPDVSATYIVFVYADDLWLVSREGGMASPLASPPGAEAFPRFSPDGQTIAFVGNYDGNKDIYTIPVSGGVPTRVTHHPATEVLSDWTPDGKLMFFTNGLAGSVTAMRLLSGIVPPFHRIRIGPSVRESARLASDACANQDSRTPAFVVRTVPVC